MKLRSFEVTDFLVRYTAIKEANKYCIQTCGSRANFVQKVNKVPKCIR